MTVRSRRPAPLRAVTGMTVAVSALALASGCASAPPPAEPTARLAVVVPVPPDAVITALRDAAIRLGGRITSETADSFRADYGVEACCMALPDARGLSRTRTESRETEVHSAATYAARRTEAGTLVTVAEDVAYWHPDERRWLRLPSDASRATEPPGGTPGPR